MSINEKLICLGIFVCLKDFIERQQIHDEVGEYKGDHVDSV